MKGFLRNAVASERALFLWSAGAAHLFVAFLVCGEADRSAHVLAGTAIISISLGGFAAAEKLTVLDALAANWLPTGMAALGLYWKLGWASPHLAAANWAERALGINLGGGWATFLVLSILSALAWLAARAMSMLQRRLESLLRR